MKLFSKKTELIISKTNNIKKLSSCFLSYIATHRHCCRQRQDIVRPRNIKGGVD